MYVLYATAQMWKHLFLCSFDAIKRLFNCALFTDGVHAICHKMKISFEILPQTDICDIDRHARKKVTGKREKIFSPNLYKAASRQAGIH